MESPPRGDPEGVRDPSLYSILMGGGPNPEGVHIFININKSIYL